MPPSEQDADASGDILNDSGFFSSTSESWAPPPQPRSTQVRNHEFPGLQRTRALRRALEQSGDTHERVLRVLQKMEDEGLNLTVFLWALSWNDDKLKRNMKAVHERTTLMHSEELGGKRMVVCE